MRERRPLVYFLLLVVLLVLAAGHRNIGRFLFPLPYYDLLAQNAANNGLDRHLVAAVVKVESNFNAQARSPRGACGLMQLMPETAAWIAGQLGERHFTCDQLFDPDVNVRFGTWYLSHLAREFQGDTVLLLAAYNAGTGRVKDWLAKADWTGERRTVDQIPFPETRHFVRKVLWYRTVYHYLYGEKP